MSLILALLLSVAARAELPYLDQDFACFDRSAADRYVREFSVDVNSFGGLELCDNNRDTKKLLNDLYLIEKTEFAAPVNHPFIRGFVDRNNYYGWMRSQTRGVDRGHDIPYATAYNSGGYFTMQDGWAVLSTLGRVGTIIHEARHTAGYRHYPCSSGPYGDSSVSGCDTTYNQGGSHGVEMEYYARVVLEAKNLHPAYQAMARLMALGRSNFVFNEQPMKKREALLALSGNKALLIDNNNVVELAAPVVRPGDRLKRTSFGASIFDAANLKASAIDLYGDASRDLADDYSYFKLFHERSRVPASVADVEEIDSGKLRFFTVLNESGSIQSYNFPRGEWFAPSAPAAGATSLITLSPEGKSGLFAVKSDGTILPFDLKARRFGSPLATRWPLGVASYAMLGSRLVALMNDGSIVDSSGTSLFQDVQSMVNVPLYDAFQVGN
jgi:hypothetical protein